MSQIFTVNLPDIGEGVVEGEVIEWLKKEGDSLKQDEPVVVVMTDKATVELPAPHPGVLAKQYFKPGEVAIKGKPLYDIQLEAPLTKPEKPASLKPEQPTSTRVEKKEAPLSKDERQPCCHQGTALAIPPVRKLAKDLGIDINQVKGTGREGRVTVADLQQVASSKTAKSEVLRLPDDEEVSVHGIPLLMAKRMALSHAHIPQFSYFEEIDAGRLVSMRDKFKEGASKEKVSVTYMPFFIRALVLTIKKFPLINSSFDSESHTLLVHKHFNIGIAVSTPYGLIVPVLKDAQNLSLEDLIRSYETLKTKALEKQLSSSDMKEATITISNYGSLAGGGKWATPVINYPEAAILAVARIQKQPAVKDDQIFIKETLNASWSFDHRIVDGDTASTCSHYFSSLIQNPARLL